MVFGEQRCSILGKATSARGLSTDRMLKRERERFGIKLFKIKKKCPGLLDKISSGNVK